MAIDHERVEREVNKRFVPIFWEKIHHAASEWGRDHNTFPTDRRHKMAGPSLFGVVAPSSIGITPGSGEAWDCSPEDFGPLFEGLDLPMLLPYRETASNYADRSGAQVREDLIERYMKQSGHGEALTGWLDREDGVPLRFQIRAGMKDEDTIECADTTRQPSSSRVCIGQFEFDRHLSVFYGLVPIRSGPIWQHNSLTMGPGPGKRSDATTRPRQYP